ncbi:MAG: type IV secretion system DNA-binding domain-containing protein [Sediminibacterium sp.]
MSNITPIGITNFRNDKKTFGIKDTDRLNHIYVIGKTGTGKSTLLLNMAISDIRRGNGICLIDPHGDIADKILDYIPKERIKDVMYFDPADETYTIAFNPLQDIPQEQQHLVVAGLIATFKKIWMDSWGPRLEYILRYALLSLCSYPDATLLDIQPLLTNYDFRKRILSYCTDKYLLSFWYNEFDKYTPQLKAEAISPILNKAGLFVAISQLRNVIGQTTSSFQIQEVMENQKILICNLSKGKLGEDATTILGSMMVNAIQLAALARAAQSEEQRKPFYLYVDEMHSFVSLSFADILAEARKYKLSLFLAHQYIEQIHEKIRYAIFGNVGTMIIFRVGADDARYLVQEVHPIFNEEDLINLPRYSMYLKLMIDGATSKPFSANTIPIPVPVHSYKQEIIQYSRELFGRLKSSVEHEISNRNKEIKKPFSAEQHSLFN